MKSTVGSRKDPLAGKLSLLLRHCSKKPALDILPSDHQLQTSWRKSLTEPRHQDILKQQKPMIAPTHGLHLFTIVGCGVRKKEANSWNRTLSFDDRFDTRRLRDFHISISYYICHFPHLVQSVLYMLLPCLGDPWSTPCFGFGVIVCDSFSSLLIVYPCVSLIIRRHYC